MPFYLASFDSLTVPPNVGSGSMDVAAGAAQAPLVTLPGGKVFDPLGSNLAYRPSALIVANVLIVNDTYATVHDTFEAWQAKIGKVGRLERDADQGFDTHYVTARLISANVKRTPIGSKIVPIVLTFQVIGFPWTGTSLGATLTPATISTHVYTATLTNGGNVTRREVVWTITPASGTMTSLTLTNTTTGHALVYTGSVLSGNVLVIDTGARTVKNNGVGDYAHLTPPTTFEDWFVLAAGANTVTYAATFAGTGVALQWQSTQAWG